MLLNPRTAPTLSYEILVAISSKISEKSKILVDVILLFTLVFVVYVVLKVLAREMLVERLFRFSYIYIYIFFLPSFPFFNDLYLLNSLK